jgi:hypothetical protein
MNNSTRIELMLMMSTDFFGGFMRHIAFLVAEDLGLEE